MPARLVHQMLAHTCKYMRQAKEALSVAVYTIMSGAVQRRFCMSLGVRKKKKKNSAGPLVDH